MMIIKFALLTALFIATTEVKASQIQSAWPLQHDQNQTGFQISDALSKQIRWDLVAEDINQRAGTTRFTRTSEDVILDTLAGTLVGLGGSSPTKDQYTSFRNALRSNLSADQGPEWVLEVVRSVNLDDGYAGLNPSTGALYNIYRNAVLITLGENDVNRLNLTLSSTPGFNEIRAVFVYYP